MPFFPYLFFFDLNFNNNLFQSVLGRFTQSFAPDITDALTKFETKSKTEGGKSNLNQIISSIFSYFPRKIPGYNKIIKDLAQIAGLGPPAIFNDLLQSFKTITDQITLFQSTLHVIPMYNRNIEGHRLIVYGSSLLFVSDLITSIIRQFGANNKESAICTAIFGISYSTLKTKTFSRLLFDQLSLIISLINETSNQSVTSLLNSLNENESFDLYLYFSKFLKITTSVPVNRFHNYLLSKVQSTEIEEAATRMFLTAPDNDQKFPDIYNKLQNSDEISKIGICIIIMQRMNCTAEELENYIDTKLVPQISNNQTIQSCLLAFWHCISGINIDPSLTFTGQTYTKINNSLEILKHRSSILSTEYLMTTFNDHFIEKVDVSLCSKQFLYIFTHIASLDFSFFLTKIFPKMIKLEVTDQRFFCLLRAVKYINHDIFQEFLTKEQLQSFNNQISEKIRDLFYSNTSSNQSENSILLLESNLRNSKTLITESTQKVLMFLRFCKVDTPTINEFKITTSEYTGESLLSSILSCIQYVFTDNDFYNDKFIDRIISFTYNHSSCISKRAHKLIKTLYHNNTQFLSCLLHKFPELIDENQVYSVTRILFWFIEKSYQFDNDQLKSLEYIALLCLTWNMPEIRDYGISILQMTNLDISTLFLQNQSILVRKVRRSIQQFGRCPLILSDKFLQFKSIFNSNSSISRLYIYEFITLLIEKNRMDIIEKSKEMIGKNFGANPGYLMYFINSFYNIENTEKVSTYLFDLIQNKKEDLVIKTIPFIHPALAVPCMQVLCSIDENNSKIATKSLLLFLHNSKMTDSIIQNIFPLILQFLSIFNTVFTQLGINSPKVIKWGKNNPEENVVSNLALIMDYLLIIEQSIQKCERAISDTIWPSSSRNLIFRFLINWAMTKDAKLKELKEYSFYVMSMLSKCGHVFDDNVLLDSSVLHLFGQIAIQYNSFLTYLLRYHTNLFLENFISAYYSQPQIIGDLFLDAIIASTEKEKKRKKQKTVYKASGSMFLLIFVLKQRNHPRADDLLFSFIELCLTTHPTKISFTTISEKLKTSKYTEVIPEYFGYAAEAVFYQGFQLLMKYKHGHIPSSDICDAMIPWISAIRLLPTQTTCAIETVLDFPHICPYQFWVQMLNATKEVKEDCFPHLLHLWTELMKSPVHGELTILFLISWREPHIKKRMFSFWTQSKPIVARLCLNFSFSYYYYITESLQRKFTNELWVIPIVFSAFRNNWSDMEPLLVEIIHFIILFNDNETFEFYKFVCSQYNICEIDTLASVKALLNHIPNLESWGNEGLKWVIGCKTLQLASKSLKIFNLILKPINIDVAKLVCKSVMYHMNNDNDINSIAEYISDTFSVFNACFQSNEQYAFDYLMCFVDSPFYQFSNVPLLVNIVSSPITSEQSQVALIPLISPLLLKIEDSERIQSMLNVFIKNLQNEELMMLVAPMKMVNKTLFSFSLDFETLFEKVSTSTLCRILPKYALMLKSATKHLMDSIFKISAMILDKVVDENNNPSLNRIYQYAVLTLFECPHSITFLTELNRKQPKVSEIRISDVAEYERTKDDVQRALSRLPQFSSQSLNTKLDYKSYLTAASYLDANSNPTILPFGAQQKLINGMIEISQKAQKEGKISLKTPKRILSNDALKLVKVIPSALDNRNPTIGITKPMIHPAVLQPTQKLSVQIDDENLVLSDIDFLRAPNV